MVGYHGDGRGRDCTPARVGIDSRPAYPARPALEALPSLGPPTPSQDWASGVRPRLRWPTFGAKGRPYGAHGGISNTCISFGSVAPTPCQAPTAIYP